MANYINRSTQCVRSGDFPWLNPIAISVVTEAELRWSSDPRLFLDYLLINGRDYSGRHDTFIECICVSQRR